MYFGLKEENSKIRQDSSHWPGGHEVQKFKALLQILFLCGMFLAAGSFWRLLSTQLEFDQTAESCRGVVKLGYRQSGDSTWWVQQSWLQQSGCLACLLLTLPAFRIVAFRPVYLFFMAWLIALENRVILWGWLGADTVILDTCISIAEWWEIH